MVSGTSNTDLKMVIVWVLIEAPTVHRHRPHWIPLPSFEQRIVSLMHGNTFQVTTQLEWLLIVPLPKTGFRASRLRVTGLLLRILD